MSPAELRTAWITFPRQDEIVRVDLNKPKTVFGRSSNCDVVLPLKGVSRAHFMVLQEGDGWAVGDLNSTNGTFINQEPTARRELRDGDRITLGPPGLVPLTITFHQPPGCRDHPDDDDSILVDDEDAAGSSHNINVSIAVEEFERSPERSGRLESPLDEGSVLSRLRAEGASPAGGAPPDGEPVASMHGAEGTVIRLFTQMGKALLASASQSEMLERVLDLAFGDLPAERGSIWLADEESGTVSSKATRNLVDAPEQGQLAISRSIVNEAVRSRRSVLVADAVRDDRFSTAASVGQMNIRSAMCAPLYHDGRVLGFIYVDSLKPWVAFSERHLELLTALATFAAVGLVKFRMFQQTLEMRNYLESVLQSINHLVLTLDNDGRLVTANGALEPLLGLGGVEARQKTFREWFPAPLNAELIEDVARVYTDPAPVYADEYEIAAPGRSAAATVNYNIVPLLDLNQRQTGVVLVLEDVTHQKRMRATLGRYLGPAIAHKVLQEDEARLGGVRQKVAVLFSDIRGYTALTESLDAVHVVELLNECFTLMVDAVLAENGVLDKYIGDSIMAVFGVPFEDPGDSARACRAALRIRQAMAAFNRERAGRNLAPVGVGIGISTGAAISGNIGSEKRLNFTCIGDGVNLASRLEGVSKTYGVTSLISEFTRRELGDEFLVRELDLVRVIGKQQPIRVYELVASVEDEVEPARLRLLGTFGKGLAAYRARDWDAALDHFDAAAREGDAPSRVFAERCRDLRENPPRLDWDGVWDMTHK